MESFILEALGIRDPQFLALSDQIRAKSSELDRLHEREHNLLNAKRKKLNTEIAPLRAKMKYIQEQRQKLQKGPKTQAAVDIFVQNLVESRFNIQVENTQLTPVGGSIGFTSGIENLLVELNNMINDIRFEISVMTNVTTAVNQVPWIIEQIKKSQGFVLGNPAAEEEYQKKWLFDNYGYMLSPDYRTPTVYQKTTHAQMSQWLLDILDNNYKIGQKYSLLAYDIGFIEERIDKTVEDLTKVKAEKVALENERAKLFGGFTKSLTEKEIALGQTATFDRKLTTNNTTSKSFKNSSTIVIKNSPTSFESSLIDATASFIAERMKEEVNITFFGRFDAFINEKGIHQLFPNTYQLLQNSKATNYSVMLQLVKTAFEKDFSKLLFHVPDYLLHQYPELAYSVEQMSERIEELNASINRNKVQLSDPLITRNEFFNQNIDTFGLIGKIQTDMEKAIAKKATLEQWQDDKKLQTLKYALLAIQAFGEVTEGKHPAELITFLSEDNPLIPNTETKVLFQLLEAISTSLLKSEYDFEKSESVWVTKREIQELRNDPVFQKFYLGLLYQKLHYEAWQKAYHRNDVDIFNKATQFELNAIKEADESIQDAVQKADGLMEDSTFLNMWEKVHEVMTIESSYDSVYQYVFDIGTNIQARLYEFVPGYAQGKPDIAYSRYKAIAKHEIEKLMRVKGFSEFAIQKTTPRITEYYFVYFSVMFTRDLLKINADQKILAAQRQADRMKEAAYEDESMREEGHLILKLLERQGIQNFVQLIDEFTSLSVSIDNNFDELSNRRKNNQKASSQEVIAYYKSALDVIDLIVRYTEGSTDTTYSNFITINNRVLDIHDAALQKQNDIILINTMSMLSYILGDKLSKNQQSELYKYGGFMVSLADAKNASQMKEAIKTIALPTGSYSIKRRNFQNLSLNSYAGVTGGLEWAFNSVDARRAWNFGFTAPIGISYSWGHKSFLNEKKYAKKGAYYRRINRATRLEDGRFLSGASSSVFVSFIDLGAIVLFRLEEDTDPLPEDVSFKQVLAPGLFYIHNIADLPLSIMGGVQLSPQLRKIDEQAASALRFNLGITVDIPLLNFYTRTEERLKD